MKKIISIILAAVMVFALAMPALAADDEVCPVIVISGYSSCNLYENYGTDTQETVWPFEVSDALNQTLDDLPNFLKCMFLFMLGNGVPAGESIAKGGEIILEKMYTNPDGTSKYNVTHYPNDPKITNYSYLVKGEQGEVNEKELCAACADKVGGENVFLFQYDFRMGVYDSATELNGYVKAVLEYTGAKKVNMFGISFGGFILGSYLSLYKETAPVNNAVLDVPALGGTSFAKRFFLGEVDFPISSLVSLAESLIGKETNLAPIFKNTKLSKVEPLASAFLKEIRELPLTWGSMWDLLSPEDYKELKPQFLDEKENAELIRKSDIIHNDVMKNYRKNFLYCMDRGINISIICNYVDYTAFGGEKLADMLLDADKTSGATCALANEKFSDGYQAVGTTCNKKSHNHIAPSMQIDASSCYLPESTWFIKDEYHGCYAKDPYGFELVKTLLFAEKRMDIYSDKDYPQFNYSRAPYRSVAADFENENPGYISKTRGNLIVTNLSETSSIYIRKIEMDGITFEMPANRIIKPGESIKISYTGSLPTGYEGLKISYIKSALGKDLYTRTIDIIPNK